MKGFYPEVLLHQAQVVFYKRDVNRVGIEYSLGRRHVQKYYFSGKQEIVVIGNGLIAKAFSHYAGNENFTVFASGVSNSSATDESLFKRELDAVLALVDNPSQLVYFSTCSIDDASLANSRYVKHKKQVEFIIRSRFKSYLIVRLPIVVGKTANPHTLTNFLYNSIKEGTSFEVYSRACRYLMDIDDVRKVVDVLMTVYAGQCKIINVCLDNRVLVSELVAIMEEILGKKGNYRMVEKGECYEVDMREIATLPLVRELSAKPGYVKDLLRKYYSSL